MFYIKQNQDTSCKKLLKYINIILIMRNNIEIKILAQGNVVLYDIYIFIYKFYLTLTPLAGSSE